MMTKAEVLKLLEVNQNERGIKNWQKMGLETSGLTSYGIGLTQLRKLAKKVGRDHDLAAELWESGNYDAKTISMLIDEPKKITREQAEQQVEQLDVGLLVHVYASCDATLAKVDFVIELAEQWMDSNDSVRRRCGYKLLYELSKDKRKKDLDDDFFLKYINRIQNSIHDQGYRVAQCMQGAIMGIGKRNKSLNKAAIEAIKAIGPVASDPDDHCEPTDILKHLTSDYFKKKFAA